MTTSLALKLLGASLLLSLVGIIAAVLLDKAIPDILALLATAALSAIAGSTVPRGAASGAPDGDLDEGRHRAP